MTNVVLGVLYHPEKPLQLNKENALSLVTKALSVYSPQFKVVRDEIHHMKLWPDYDDTYWINDRDFHVHFRLYVERKIPGSILLLLTENKLHTAENVEESAVSGAAFSEDNGESWAIVRYYKGNTERTRSGITHEFGHFLGLAHCNNENCLMFKGSKEKYSFCKNHQESLKRRLG